MWGCKFRHFYIVSAVRRGSWIWVYQWNLAVGRLAKKGVRLSSLMSVVDESGFRGRLRCLTARIFCWESGDKNFPILNQIRCVRTSISYSVVVSQIRIVQARCPWGQYPALSNLLGCYRSQSILWPSSFEHSCQHNSLVIVSSGQCLQYCSDREVG